MRKESQLRALSERVLQATLSTLVRRPIPSSAHQAAADLYNAVDTYADAVKNNQLLAARAAIEKLAVETMRVLIGYEAPAQDVGIDQVKVESATQNISRQNSKV
jgi:hypothetical protein